MEKYLETGKIVGTHGVRGEIRVEPWCDTPEFLKSVPRLYFENGAAEIKITSRRVHKSMLLMCIDGIDNLDKAEELRGKVLYIDRDDVNLGDGYYFIQDLLGLRAFDAETDKYYGKITDVFTTAANGVYEIEDDAGTKFYFPAVKHMIAETNPNEGWIKLRPIPGIFGDEEENHED